MVYFVPMAPSTLTLHLLITSHISFLGKCNHNMIERYDLYPCTIFLKCYRKIFIESIIHIKQSHTHGKHLPTTHLLNILKDCT